MICAVVITLCFAVLAIEAVIRIIGEIVITLERLKEKKPTATPDDTPDEGEMDRLYDSIWDMYYDEFDDA
jgi:hypothetical protein